MVIVLRSGTAECYRENTSQVVSTQLYALELGCLPTKLISMIFRAVISLKGRLDATVVTRLRPYSQLAVVDILLS